MSAGPFTVETYKNHPAIKGGKRGHLYFVSVAEMELLSRAINEYLHMRDMA